MLAVFKAGAGYVPLDPAFPAERLAFMVADARLSLVVSQSELREVHGAPVEHILELDQVREELDALSADQLCDSDWAAHADDVAYVLYTSGSTGKPKGVMVQHRAAVNFLTSMLREPGLTPDDRLLAITTLSFDISLLELMLPLCVGAEVIVATRAQAMDGGALRQLLESEHVTVLQATPATWRLLIESGWQGCVGFRALCGGEPLPVDLAESILERVDELWNLYGPTETTVWSTCCRVKTPSHGISIGHPIANTAIWILDGNREPCPIGVAGEIYIGGAGVAVGYLNRPELTAEKFIEDRFSRIPGARLYRTGDLGLWTGNGELKCLGRTDFQVKVRGHRIELGEIESKLCEHPQVKQAAVVAREDNPGDVRLVAYAIIKGDSAPEIPNLRKHLAAVLPDYMIPQHFVFLEVFPTTPNGKLDRARLPRPAESDASKSPVLPSVRSPMEEKVQKIWSEHLGYQDFSLQESFFEIGGNSLMAARIIMALEKELERTIGLTTFFQHPTVERLAQAISEQTSHADASTLDPVVERVRRQREALLRRGKPRTT
jgi:amino acid adenylation domain-containing protein